MNRLVHGFTSHAERDREREREREMPGQNSSIAAGVMVAFGLVFGATKFYRMQHSKSPETTKTKEEEEEEEEEKKNEEDVDVDDVELVQFRYAWTEHALLRIGKINYQETNVVYPSSAAVGQCPYLRIGRRVLTSSDRILAFARRRERKTMNTQIKGLSEAFHSLIREMHVLIMHRRWCSSNRTIKKKTECDFDRVPRFIRWYVRRSRRKEIEQYLRVSGILNLTDQQVTNRLVAGFKALDSHLNAFDTTYFFGDEPTTIDAAVFGITAIVMNEEMDGIRKRVKNECVYIPGFYQAFKIKYFDGWPRTENCLVGDTSYRPSKARFVPLRGDKNNFKEFEEFFEGRAVAMEGDDDLVWTRETASFAGCMGLIFLTTVLTHIVRTRGLPVTLFSSSPNRFL
jgi:hypothetical protein